MSIANPVPPVQTAADDAASVKVACPACGGGATGADDDCICPPVANTLPWDADERAEWAAMPHGGW